MGKPGKPGLMRLSQAASSSPNCCACSITSSITLSSSSRGYAFLSARLMATLIFAVVSGCLCQSNVALSRIDLVSARAISIRSSSLLMVAMFFVESSAS